MTSSRSVGFSSTATSRDSCGTSRCTAGGNAWYLTICTGQLNTGCVIARTLIIRAEPLEMILDGKKDWEIGSGPAQVRSRIAPFKKGADLIVGTCTLDDVEGPLTLEQVLKQSADDGLTRADVDSDCARCRRDGEPTAAPPIGGARTAATPCVLDRASSGEAAAPTGPTALGSAFPPRRQGIHHEVLAVGIETEDGIDRSRPGPAAWLDARTAAASTASAGTHRQPLAAPQSHAHPPPARNAWTHDFKGSVLPVPHVPA